MYRILIRDPIACLDYERSTRGHSQAVRLARTASEGGMRATVINSDNGNVVIWLGENLADKTAKFRTRLKAG